MPARQSFGRLTHAAQDFYAHSNYIALWRESHPEAAPNETDPLIAVLLSAQADSLTNAASGTWNTAGGTNDFGTGTDVLDNSGLIVAASDAGLAEVTTFNQLETFNNLSGGRIMMQDGATGDRTITSGDFNGSGGAVYVDTFLGDETSPSDIFDIGGNTSGTSLLFVQNTTGGGALTSGNGIQVVLVGGASTGTFTLGAPVIGGAYSYNLNKADGQNWYLQSILTPVDPVDPVDPVIPSYQPGVPLYESYAGVLLGMNDLTTLQQRVGNRSWTGNAQVEEGGPARSTMIEKNALWTRIDGAHGYVKPNASTSSSSIGTDAWTLHTGVDGVVVDNDKGKLIAGISAHYGESAASISSRYGTGNIDVKGYGLGTSLTWYGMNGAYIDAQGAFSWYDSSLSSDALGSLIKNNRGTGYALSLETGQRIALNNGWTTTPQAQLTYSAVSFDRFTGPNAELVSLSNGDSLKARLGLTLDRETTWVAANGSTSRSHVYGIGNLYYEFLDGTDVDVSGTRLNQSQERLTGGLGLGGSYNWNNDKYSLYGEALMKGSMSNSQTNYAVNGKIGLRASW